MLDGQMDLRCYIDTNTGNRVHSYENYIVFDKRGFQNRLTWIYLTHLLPSKNELFSIKISY